MKRPDKIVVYCGDHLHDWRWTRHASNGRIVGASTEGYRSRAKCIANARRCMTECAVTFRR